MSFYYEPMTEEQAEKERQFPMLDPGIYDFEVINSEFKMSNTGPYHDPSKPSNPMISLQLMIWDNNGKEFIIFDNLMGTAKMAWKTIHFCDSVGLKKEYDSGKLHENMCLGKRGKAIVTIQSNQKKKGGGYFKDKNSIEDYVMTDKGALKTDLSGKSPEPKDDFSDDIPF